MMNTKNAFKLEYSKQRKINSLYGASHVRNGANVTFRKWIPEATRNASAIKDAAYLCALTPIGKVYFPGIYAKVAEQRKQLLIDGLGWISNFAGIKAEIAAARLSIEKGE